MIAKKYQFKARK